MTLILCREMLYHFINFLGIFQVAQALSLILRMKKILLLILRKCVHLLREDAGRLVHFVFCLLIKRLSLVNSFLITVENSFT